MLGLAWRPWIVLFGIMLAMSLPGAGHSQDVPTAAQTATEPAAPAATEPAAPAAAEPVAPAAEPAVPAAEPVAPAPEPAATSAGPAATAGETAAAVEAAEDKQVVAFSAKLEEWRKQIKAAEDIVTGKTASDEQLRDVPEQLEALRAEIVEQRTSLRPKLDEARARLDRLGPAPEKDGPKESPETTAQRERLSAEFAAIDGLMKQADVVLVRAKQLADTANAERRERFTKLLFRPVPSFYSNVLPSALERAPLQIKSMLNAFGDWIVRAVGNGPPLILLLLLAPIGAAIAARRLLIRIATFRAAKRQRTKKADLTLQQRGSAAVLNALRHAAPAWAALGAFYLLASAAELADPSWDGFLAKASLATAWASFLVTVVRQSLVPTIPSHRLVAVGDALAQRLALLLWILIAVWLFDQIWGLADRVVFTPYQMTVFRSTVVSVLYSAILIALLMPIRSGSVARNGSDVKWPGWLFWSVALSAGFLIIAVLLGYPELARFVGAHLVSTAGVLWLMYLLHLVAESISSVSVISGRQIEEEGAPENEADAPSLLTIRIIAGLLMDIIIVLVGITILLLLWRFDWVEVKGWIQAAFFGVQFGDLRISLQSVLIALGVFAVGLLLTRFVQRWFIGRAFAGRQKDSGLQESTRIGLGYVGFVLSALAGMSYLGLDFSSLAIVAGALSVGIGFGLQSIVNNFVSGVILLVERPIKIGDWIEVAGFEGAVKKISVRSTEIETIYRQSVIIPNANLITNPVTNWMHADRTCRLDLPIGVAYGTDVTLLRTTLLGVAAAHRAVLKHPVPVLHFAGFGDSSLDFQLRVFLRDAGQRVATASELRFAVLAALTDAGIEIPFPQRDVHIKGGGQVEAPDDGGENEVPPQEK
jgi:potassium-dependent mechanosensitive channel